MNALTSLKARLASRTDSEHEQALVRIFIAVLVLAGMWMTHLLHGRGSSPETALLMRGVAVFLVFSVGVFAAICIWPAANVSRRLLGMLADVAVVTFCIYLSGDAGVAIFGVYLFITFGYGFRFGRHYLFACQDLCIAGYGFVLLDPAYREAHPGAWWGLLLTLIVLPLYVSTLLKRIEDARRRAEDAHRASSRA